MSNKENRCFFRYLFWGQNLWSLQSVWRVLVLHCWPEPNVSIDGLSTRIEFNRTDTLGVPTVELELELNKIYSQYGFDIIFDNATVLFQYIFYAEVPRATVREMQDAAGGDWNTQKFLFFRQEMAILPFQTRFRVGKWDDDKLLPIRYDDECQGFLVAICLKVDVWVCVCDNPFGHFCRCVHNGKMGCKADSLIQSNNKLYVKGKKSNRFHQVYSWRMEYGMMTFRRIRAIPRQITYRKNTSFSDLYGQIYISAKIRSIWIL